MCFDCFDAVYDCAAGAYADEVHGGAEVVGDRLGGRFAFGGFDFVCVYGAIGDGHVGGWVQEWVGGCSEDAGAGERACCGIELSFSKNLLSDVTARGSEVEILFWPESLVLDVQARHRMRKPAVGLVVEWTTLTVEAREVWCVQVLERIDSASVIALSSNFPIHASG